MVPEPTRDRLLAILADMPGASTRAVSERLGVSESTAGYHLRRLVRQGEARSQVVGRDRCWYTQGCGLCPILRRALPRLRRDTVAKVARVVSELPMTATDLAAETSLDRGSVRWAAQELERAFLVDKTAGGRVFVREGAEVCIAKGLAGEACGLWGRCEISKQWRERAAGLASPTDEAPRPRARS